MGRSIIAVIASYIAMFVLNLIAFVGLFLMIGTDNAFRPRSYLASNRWIAISFAIIFVTAIISGLICAVIAKGGKAPLALAVVVIVLGLLLAAAATALKPADTHEVRTGNVSNMDAMNKARHPTWV